MLALAIELQFLRENVIFFGPVGDYVMMMMMMMMMMTSMMRHDDCEA